MQSSAENDERVVTLAKAALHMAAAERLQFLRRECKGEPELFAEVSDMVEWEERMGDFLRQPLINLVDLEESEPEHPETVFRPGQEISDRFFIMREVGQGGMAVVYEAFDRKVNKRIAIKCAKPGFGRLLAPELERALGVRHPNVCLVNDTHTAKTDSGEVDFLKMEFLDGETLAARLAHESKLSPEEALVIARQLCAGLAAAHQAGIVHRDLKPGNIILTKNESGHVRAVITDFGLAAESRLESPIEGGTPRYMAPEVWQDHKSDKAADVYALGVILYEMITGTDSIQPSLRWDGTPTPPAEPPSIANEDLPALWDKVILPCLDRRPERRPEAAEILKVFDKRPIWKSPVIAIIALMLVSLAAAFQGPLMRLFKPADIRLAVLPPESSDVVQLADADLHGVVEQIRQVGRGSVVVFAPSDLVREGVQTPEQARTKLHATHVVRLMLKGEGAGTELKADILELRHGTHLRDFKGRYSSVTAPDLPSALAAAIASALHLPNPSPAGAVSPSAAADYEKGLFFLNRDDGSYKQAMEYFSAAAKKDPHSGLPLAGLAEVELSKFSITTDRQWMDAALQHVQQAEALSPDSVPVLLARGDLQVNASQWEQGLESYQRAEELEPNNSEVLLRMAEAYERQNLLDAALRFHRRAIAANPDNFKVYQKLGLFYYRRGDNAAMAEQFQKAVDLAPERYDLHIYLASARGEEGNYRAAEQEFAASLSIRKSGWALCGLGAIRESERRDEEAARLLAQSVALDPRSTTCYLNLGDSLRRLHRRRAARAAYVRALALSSAEIRNDPRGGFQRAFIGYLAARLGQRSRAIDETEEALQLFPHDTKVLRRAILTYEALGERTRALEVAAGAPGSVLQELDRHPDLAAFHQDPRFRDLLDTTKKRGT
jgi:tetratricopeptide (TPR) repeat protein/tRNA A-37 threonylcarbamoyl transferase component Bud32